MATKDAGHRAVYRAWNFLGADRETIAAGIPTRRPFIQR
jgi:hypothetical protein